MVVVGAGGSSMETTPSKSKGSKSRDVSGPSTSTDTTDIPQDSTSSNSFVESVLQRAIAQVCTNVGWNSIGDLSLDILTEVTGQYIKSLGSNSTKYANQAGRSQVTLSDVILSFDSLHFNVNELREYLNAVEPHPIPFPVAKTPAKLRPSNRIPFSSSKCLPYTDDTVIGYAVTDSEDESEEEEDQDVGGGDGENLVDPITGQVVSKKPVKEKKRYPFKRSDYYEEWMPPFPRERQEEEGKEEEADLYMNKEMNQEESLAIDNELNGLKLSEIEPSRPLTSVYLSSSGQLIPVNGAVPILPDKSFPDFSDQESMSESDEDDESCRGGEGMGGLYSTEGIRQTGVVDKITIRTNTGVKDKKRKEKVTKVRQNKAVRGDKLNQLISRQGKNKDGGKIPTLSIKVSGLSSGTPTASPKLDLPPEVEERMDDTIDSVIASVMTTDQQTKRKPGRPKESKSQKEYSSKEFVDEEDSSSSDDNSNSNSKPTVMEPLFPPVLIPSTKGSPKKADTSVDSVIRGTMMSKSSPHSMSPDRRSDASTAKSPTRTKAAAKVYEKSTPTKMNETDAAEILMSFSSNPVESQPLTNTSPTQVDSSPFNLGKILERARQTSPSHFKDLIGSPNETHPFAPNPPPQQPVIKTLAMKKAVYQEKIAKSEEDEDEPIDSDEEVLRKMDKIARGDDEDEDEKRRSKKEKKKKKKESKDRDREKRKKDKKNKNRERDRESTPGSTEIKLNIKLSKPEKKLKEKEKESSSKSCLLFTETIKQSSSIDKSKSVKKSEPKKEKRPVGRPRKDSSSSAKGKAKTKQEDEEDVYEDEDGKVWICPSCSGPDDGSPMVGCDNCEEWYHWACVGIKKDPEEDSWFCPRCTEKQRKLEQAVKGGTKRKIEETKKSGSRKMKDEDASDSLDSDSDGNPKKKRKKKPG